MNEIPTTIQGQIDRMAKSAEFWESKGDPGIARKRAEMAPALAKAGFPARHSQKVDEGLYGPSHEKALELLSTAMKNDAILILIGNKGPGKTQMATFWAAERARAGLPVGKYAKLMDIIADIKATWHTGGANIGTEMDVLKKYYRTGFLVIDEMQAIAAHEFEIAYLVNILDHRYDAMLATVLIANVGNDDASLKKIIPASILDRATETGGLVHCEWESYRK